MAKKRTFESRAGVSMTGPAVSSSVAEPTADFPRITELEPRVIAREAEIVRLKSVNAELQTETMALRAAVHLMRASLSWRITAPIRTVGGLARILAARHPALWRSSRKLLGLLYPVPVVPPTPSAPPPIDANARYVFQPAPPSDDGTGVVTLDTLFHLSRSL
jgi:hypothetical protein